MKALVTGGLGFIGAALCKKLAAEGHEVRVLDNESRGAARRLRDMEVLHGDIRNPSAVAEALRGVDTVFHLAAVNGTELFYERPAVVLDVGVRGILNVIDGCVTRGVTRIVFLSSSEVYHQAELPTPETAPLVIPDPYNPRYSYSGSKIISELLLLHNQHFERVVIARPHNVYGPDMGWEHVIPQFIMRLRRLIEAGAPQPIRFPIRGDGEQQRAFIHVDDCVQALLLMTEKGEHRGIYHVGSMHTCRMRDVAAAVAAILGVEITVEASAAMLGEPHSRCPDTTRLRSLGFEPTWLLHDGLASTTDWYISHRSLWP